MIATNSKPAFSTNIVPQSPVMTDQNPGFQFAPSQTMFKPGPIGPAMPPPGMFGPAGNYIGPTVPQNPNYLGGGKAWPPPPIQPIGNGDPNARPYPVQRQPPPVRVPPMGFPAGQQMPGWAGFAQWLQASQSPGNIFYPWDSPRFMPPPQIDFPQGGIPPFGKFPPPPPIGPI